MEQITYEWKWWFPENPDNVVFWILKEENWYYKLTLHWKLNIEEEKFKNLMSWGWTYNKNFINGVTKDWKILSLYSYVNIWTHTVLGGNGYDTENFQALYVFDGVHLESESDLIINKVSFTFNGLFEWVWKGMVDFSMTKFEDKKHYSKWVLDIWDNNINNIWEIAENLSISIENGYNIAPKDIFFDKLDTKHRLFKSLNVDQFTNIVLGYTVDTDFSNVLNDLEHLRKLYSLIMWKSIYFTDFKCSIWESKDITIFFDKSVWNNKESLWKANILFNYWDLTNKNINALFQTWFSNIDKYKLIFDIYFSTIENQGLHLENQFLNIIQALEWYYYIKFWKTKKKVILLNKIQIISDDINYIIPDKKYIVDCRHTLSHWDNRDAIYDNMERFYHKSLDLKLLLELSIIKDLLLEGDLFNEIKNSRKRDMIYTLK